MSLTKEEIEDRVNYLGASDSAASLGMSRYKTQLQLWGEKCGQLQPTDISERTSVKLGDKMEEAVAEMFTERTGLQVEKIPMITHPNYDFIRARPDRKVIDENAGVECKYVGIRRSKEFEEDQIPQEFLIQCHHQNMVCGFDRTYLAYVIGNEVDDFKIIERDENIIQQILQGELNFWNNFVVPGIMPMQITAKDSNTLLSLFPYSEPNEVVQFDEETGKMIEFRNALVMDKFNVETQISAYENQIKAKMGNAEKGICTGFDVYWESQSRNSLNVDLLKKERPQIYSQYLRTINSRKFTIKSKVISKGVGTNESE